MSSSTAAGESAPPREPVEAEPPPSLRTLAIRGSAWTLAGFGAGQVLRLASNVLLASLLAPALIGIMGTVTLLLGVLQLFSDVGIGPSIIHNKRGEERGFLDTAWTISVLRGGVLWFAAAVLAWPFAVALHKPDLVWLLPVAGATAFVGGFNSTSLYVLNRRLAMGRLTALDLATQVIGIVVMIGWALVSPTVWSLVAGGLASALFRAVASHGLLPGAHPRFFWDRGIASELLRFGRWVFISTAIGFMADRGYQLVISERVSDAVFGVFWIAAMFPQAIGQGVARLGQGILFPAYSRVGGGTDNARLRRVVLKTQLAVLALTLPPLCLFVVFGPQIIRLLYEPPYHEAGWMLQILAAGQIVASVVAARIPVLLARGDSRRHMLVQLTHAILLVGSVGVGAATAGLAGMVWGISIAQALNYPVTVWATRHYGAWIPWLEAAAFAGSGAAIGLGLWLL